METVKQFLDARRRGDSESAATFLLPDATLGSPWGYRYGNDEYVTFLNDEKKFTHREYLEDKPIEEIAPNTFQRKFEYDRGMVQHHNMRSHSWFTGPWTWWLPVMGRCGYYREIYWVKDDKVRLVTCHQQP